MGGKTVGPDQRMSDQPANNPNEQYEIENGRILTRSLEIHVVDHCNLRCAHCCSLSPVSDDALVSAEELRHSLGLAKSALSPQRLKLVGGEPLLHPELIACMEGARESEIAKSVSVTTNGFLLPKMQDRFWELIDHMTVSLYPKPSLAEKTIQFIREKAEENEVEVNWKTQNSFVKMDRPEADHLGIETRAVYTDCWLRRSCHLLAGGRFYTCTRPAHMHAVAGLEDSPFKEDGVLLEGAGSLRERIYDYLISRKPLASCALCFGGDAAEEAHSQLEPKEVIAERITRQRVYRDYAESCSTSDR